jgi:hypothetical protein
MVVAAGGNVLVRYCYEEGSFRPTYQPFVEAFTIYALQSASDALRSDLQSIVVELARIVCRSMPN